MGFKVAWIACKDKSLDTMIADLRLKRAGRTEDVPEAEYDGIALPSGWALVLNNYGAGGTDDLMLSGKLERVRAGTQGLMCYVNDTTMMSTISGFHGEADVWSVTYDGEKSRTHLEVEGTPPDPFPALREALTKRQQESQNADHLYEIAATMGEALTGFYHEKTDGPFAVLERAKRFGLFRRG